jgi:hypothetical protein
VAAYDCHSGTLLSSGLARLRQFRNVWFPVYASNVTEVRVDISETR